MEPLPIRLIQVERTARVTPHMARITFRGEGLDRPLRDEPDQQVKLYFPKPSQHLPRLPELDAEGDFTRWYAAFNAIPERERPWMRSYTLRAHDLQLSTVDIDFVLHESAGPATHWAQAARPGDTLGMFGPSRMFAKPVPLSTSVREADWLLLAGDESALPAMSTIVESLPLGARALMFVEVGNAAEEQHLETAGQLSLTWLHRNGAQPGRSDLLLDAVRTAEFPSGPVLAWLGGEAGSVRALRRHLIGERGIDRARIDFTGYWRPRLTQDDAPTEEDLRDAQELMSLRGLGR
jgi:NADPH-dependent ferric siderophore reductase